MVLLITGASHTGKTLLAQRILEKNGFPYLSIDHLKMGLIRSGHTSLTPLSNDNELTELLWPILREMIKTAIENGQNLTIEGCYIPFDFKKAFSDEYLKHIRPVCLIMSEEYLKAHFDDVKKYENVIERRLDPSFDLTDAIEENKQNLSLAKKYGFPYILIEDKYEIDASGLM